MQTFKKRRKKCNFEFSCYNSILRCHRHKKERKRSIKSAKKIFNSRSGEQQSIHVRQQVIKRKPKKLVKLDMLNCFAWSFHRYIHHLLLFEIQVAAIWICVVSIFNTLSMCDQITYTVLCSCVTNNLLAHIEATKVSVFLTEALLVNCQTNTWMHAHSRMYAYKYKLISIRSLSMRVWVSVCLYCLGTLHSLSLSGSGSLSIPITLFLSHTSHQYIVEIKTVW